MKEKSPKVFICHASEDKERFVLDFAKKLIEKGVDAWFDKWEMLPGDSLVDKVFEEGIKECNTFIIILSQNSINKKWVREELNSAMVLKIEEATKIIPVLIDESIDVPQCLKHTLWEQIGDLSNYEEEFKRILMAIYDIHEKPPVGTPPKFVTGTYDIPDLAKVDSIILKITGDIIFEKDDIARYVEVREVTESARSFEISEDQVAESLEVLESRGFLRITRVLSGIKDSPIMLSPFGFVDYCNYFLQDFERIRKGVISSIMNEGLKLNKEIATKLGCKLVVVGSLLDYFDMMGYIKLNHFVGGVSAIFHISGEGKRYFRNVLEGI